jgi:predicted regulator of Ras-like GTPase activity (Roadblock/LC7/MglB family)
MDSEVYSVALKNTLNEIQKACPDIKNALLFREDGEIIAGDDGTPEKITVRTVDALDGIFEKAEALGGIEGIILEGNRGRVDVSHMNDLYLLTVTSKKADMNYVNTLTHVLIPTVLKLLEKINPAPLNNNPPKLETEPEDSIIEKPEKPTEELVGEPKMEKPMSHPEPEAKHEQILAEVQANQFIVEDIGGLLVATDTVRIDNGILLQWRELCEDRKIEEVIVETFGGKSTRCKLKPIKDSKYEGKGIIQIPVKLQLTLETKKGELVRVKPVVE